MRACEGPCKATLRPCAMRSRRPSISPPSFAPAKVRCLPCLVSPVSPVLPSLACLACLACFIPLRRGRVRCAAAQWIGRLAGRVYPAALLRHRGLANRPAVSTLLPCPPMPPPPFCRHGRELVASAAFSRHRQMRHTRPPSAGSCRAACGCRGAACAVEEGVFVGHYVHLTHLTARAAAS